MTLDQAMALDDTAEVNWGELASELLSPEQQAHYEGQRIPAWLRYQRHVAIAKMRDWSQNAEIMPIHWHTYRIATAQAFKTAAQNITEAA